MINARFAGQNGLSSAPRLMRHDINHDWSRWCRFESVGSKLQFELPARPLGTARVLSVMTIGFGLLAVYGPVKRMCDGMQTLRQSSSIGFNAPLVFMTLLFVFAGCVRIMLGLLILFGRCRVTREDGWFHVSEIIGPVRWTHKLPHKRIRAFEVHPPPPQSAGSVAVTINEDSRVGFDVRRRIKIAACAWLSESRATVAYGGIADLLERAIVSPRRR